jgi:hypothetical protein
MASFLLVTGVLKPFFYVPESHLERVKSAMFEAGAGRVGNYDSCAWQTAGEGQYRPLEGNRPFMGELSSVESVSEYKVEIVCATDLINEVVDAMKSAPHHNELPERTELIKKIKQQWQNLLSEDDIESIDLHYLEHGIEVDLTVTLDEISDHLAAELEQVICSIEYIPSLRIFCKLYESDPDRRPP